MKEKLQIFKIFIGLKVQEIRDAVWDFIKVVLAITFIFLITGLILVIYERLLWGISNLFLFFPLCSINTWWSRINPNNMCSIGSLFMASCFILLALSGIAVIGILFYDWIKLNWQHAEYLQKQRKKS